MTKRSQERVWKRDTKMRAAHAMNIRTEADRTALAAQGFTWVTVVPRGDDKGIILSKHKTYEAANKAARNRDRAIIDVQDSAWY